MGGETCNRPAASSVSRAPAGNHRAVNQGRIAGAVLRIQQA